MEFERRFLLEAFPAALQPSRVRRIADRYIVGTTLRLRIVTEDRQTPLYKLTQKLPEGWITSMYLTGDEYRVILQLPADPLSKSRYSVPPFGIDVFEGPLDGLVMAEAEFESASAARAFVAPPYFHHEVTGDPRFTGGRLARTTAEEIRTWLAEAGRR